MNEANLIKKQLLKNMLVTFIVFTIILIFFDAIIYNRVFVSLYKEIDEELIRTAQNYVTDKDIIMKRPGNIFELKINPRLVYIIRNSDGTIINSESIGRFYSDYSSEVQFDSKNMNKIYSIKIQNQYNYRGISVSTYNELGEKIYVQLLANVDGETETIENLTEILLIGSTVIIVISIVSSYILSKRTLKPIVDSYRKQTEFVQNASHELRTPLTIIQAKQELLLQEPESKIIDKSEDINIILKESKRLTKLIKELMILAMADSNELKMNKEKTNIDNLIKEISVPYIDFATMQSKEIKLNLKHEREINVDRNKISQLIVIILDNAIKYTAENDRIEINTYSKDGKCIIEISDTGIGISKEAAEHVFDRFYREDKARSREKGGIGLGLAIAHTIVTMHGGTIKLVQNEPKGTKVIIRI